ncbi:MAG TPA: hypothetical protein VNO70_18320 [Blastocatellia bacterium]|nr:hypothetical protein [Blastocatellia bacterium]
MNKRVSMMIITLCLFGAMAVASAQAQTVEKFVVHIPFSFTVGGKTLPAGDYRIETIAFGGAQLYSKLLIKSTDGRSSRIVATLPARSRAMQERSKLIFHRYGEQYFLSRVWTAGTDTGRELRKTSAEEKLARGGTERQVVPILARP